MIGDQRLVVTVGGKMKSWALVIAMCLLSGCSAADPNALAVGQPASPPAQQTPSAPGTSHLLAVTVPMPPRVTGHYPSSCHIRTENGKTLPDPTCTPGSINPAVNISTVRRTICVPGWTRTVRPPASNTNAVKTQAMQAYGEQASARPTTEFDHLVPLELGGSDDVTNLWPEPTDLPGHGVNNSKDSVERALGKAVCAGKVGLAPARQAIATDWTTAEQVLGIH
jgi:hypothetical protein